ncbi:MAG TPA: SWIM zinc finger family protein [Anaerolineales bacterium]|nr:SWIM zinc finger family protein [Anaerolineales bacterium]
MTKLTAEQVKSLAPDPSSLKSAQGLADARHWASLGGNNVALWGECKGSGKEPYKVRVDLANMGYACSCPSRKFPCKHCLGLMLMSATSSTSLTEKSPPPWVTEWLEKREERKSRAEKKAPTREETPETTAARQKDAARRAEKREKLTDIGIDSLEKWLKDFARAGLAFAQSAPPSFWNDQTARMIDSQLPGAARLIREMATLPGTRADWAEILLLRLARLHALVNAYRRLEGLPQTTQQDVRGLLGWSVNQDELLASTQGYRDDWLVLHTYTELDEKTNLRTQVNWLWGRVEKRIALILNFAHQSQPMDASLVQGLVLQGELVYFLGAHPLRAIFREKRVVNEKVVPQGFKSVRDLLDSYAVALGYNPWLENFPAVLEMATPMRVHAGWVLKDTEGYILPLPASHPSAWELFALGGGHPLTIFGTWDGSTFTPLAAWESERLVNLL